LWKRTVKSQAKKTKARVHGNARAPNLDEEGKERRLPRSEEVENLAGARWMGSLTILRGSKKKKGLGSMAGAQLEITFKGGEGGEKKPLLLARQRHFLTKEKQIL